MGETRYTRWTVRRDDGLYVFDGMTGRVTPLGVAVEEQQVEVSEAVAEIVEDKPARKKRRTKAEMAEARAAEALAKGADLTPSTTDAALVATGAGAILARPSKETQDERLARRAAEIEARAQEALQVASEYEITDQESMDFVAAWITESAKELKSIEEERDSLTKPLLEVKNKIYNRFKPGVGFYGALCDTLKRKVAAFRLERQKQQDAALKAIAESGGKTDGQTLVIAQGAGVVALPAGVREKVTWTWTQVDFSKVPDEYKVYVLNTEKIGREVDARGGDCDIPGIRVERHVDIHRTGR